MNAQANDVITADEMPVRALTTTPHDLLAMAVQSGANMETLERLMDLQDRWDAKKAKNAFTEAMAEFKKNPPEILKRKLVSFETRGGDKTEYRHAEIGDVCNAVVSTLGAAGFSHNWQIKQETVVEVTCVVTHRLGHSESVTLKAGADASGGKNAIQAIASTVTYLERYTLLAAVGLATNSMDDDGRGFDQHGNPMDEPELTPEQKALRRKAQHDEAFDRHSESIKFIKDRLQNEDVKAACDEWAAIPQPDQMALWLATTKGGCLSTAERETIKTGKQS
jgi:hypothetical protein